MLLWETVKSLLSFPVTTSLVPTSCRNKTPNCTSSFPTNSEMQATLACEIGRVFSRQKGLQLARLISRCPSTNSETREVQFMATTSRVLQTGAQSILLAKLRHPSTRFVIAIDVDSEHFHKDSSSIEQNHHIERE